MELAKLNEWTEIRRPWETQPRGAQDGEGMTWDWTGQRLPTSPHPRYRMTTEECKCCGMWEGLGVEMEGGAVPPQGQSGDALGQTGGTYHAPAERNQSSSVPLGGVGGAPHCTPDRSFWMLPLLPTMIREEQRGRP